MYFMYRCGTTSKICQVKKSKAQQSELPFCTEGVGGDTRPLVFIYGSGLEGSSCAQATLGSTVPTLLWLFKNWFIFRTNISIFKTRSPRP